MSGRAAAILMLGFLVAGCGHADDAAAPSHRDNAAVAAIDAAVAGNSIAAKAEGLPVEQPRAAAFRNDLPPAFLGRWGRTPRDCDRSVGDPTGLLIVEPGRLRFYTATASVGGFDSRSPTDIVVRLDYRDPAPHSIATELSLGVAGTTLTRTERGSAATERYQRC